MLEGFFTGLFSSSAQTSISLSDFLLCMGVSLLLGIVMAACYRFQSKGSQSFVTTLALLPAVVCVVILLVNGSVGAGVAVAGTFSLVRFRSVPGSAREIGAIFVAMAAGLATGMGYLAFAAVFTLVLCAVQLIYGLKSVSRLFSPAGEQLLRITIPEDLDYTGIFDDLFQKYLAEQSLLEVKTTNLGSLFRLTYAVRLKQSGQEKHFLDELRCRNGNLEISLSRQALNPCEL